jgi:hypothetical protein
MSAITPELKAQYFPLLDDMGSMEEIYTLEELKNRVKIMFTNTVGPNWRQKWLKGLSTWRSHIDPKSDRTTVRLIYYNQVCDILI